MKRAMVSLLAGITRQLGHGCALSEQAVDGLFRSEWWRGETEPGLATVDAAMRLAGSQNNDSSSIPGIESWPFDGEAALCWETGTGRLRIRATETDIRVEAWAGPSGDREAACAAWVMYSVVYDDDAETDAVEVAGFSCSPDLLGERWDRISLLVEIDQKAGGCGLLGRALRVSSEKNEGYVRAYEAARLSSLKREVICTAHNAAQTSGITLVGFLEEIIGDLQEESRAHAARAAAGGSRRPAFVAGSENSAEIARLFGV